jgi:isopentenyl diphosphate isomerase/L-lactate dehydrogenase-like FMN-dependent dehydrogenase
MGLKVAMFGIGASNILGLKNNKYLVKKEGTHL